MNMKLALIITLSLFNGSAIYASAHNSTQVKPRGSSSVVESEGTTRVFHPSKYIADYGQEVRRLEDIIQAFVKSNEEAQAVHTAALKVQQQKLSTINEQMELRKKSLAEAEKTQAVSGSHHHVLIAKAHLTPSLLEALTESTAIITLLNSRIAELMKKNKELEGTLKG